MPYGNNRELITLVEAISGSGNYIPLIVIITAKTMLEKWCDWLPASYLIYTTESGYSTDITCLNYIKHFYKITKNRVKGTWILLLMDGYDSYHTYEFLLYVERKKIKIYALSSHTLHFLQPLDVGCFQLIKWHYGQALNKLAWYSGHKFNKTDFLTALPYIRQRTFTRSIIAVSFRRTGIILFNSKKVLLYLCFLENVNPN